MWYVLNAKRKKRKRASLCFFRSSPGCSGADCDFSGALLGIIVVFLTLSGLLCFVRGSPAYCVFSGALRGHPGGSGALCILSGVILAVLGHFVFLFRGSPSCSGPLCIFCPRASWLFWRTLYLFRGVLVVLGHFEVFPGASWLF